MTQSPPHSSSLKRVLARVIHRIHPGPCRVQEGFTHPLRYRATLAAMLLLVWPMPGSAQPVIPAKVVTQSFHQYEEAPATPDADDIAIWIHPRHLGRSLVIGTLKDAGLIVYDLRGRVLQKIPPPNLPAIAPLDPPTPAGLNPASPQPCSESENGENFGRFNNVDIAYGVVTDYGRPLNKSDVAVVSDRGCDRLRFYRIDPENSAGPLIDITDADVPRVYLWRVTQPSPLQPTDLPGGLHDNPLDEQNTAYGLALWRTDRRLFAFVSQRSRSALSQLEIIPSGGGTLTYRTVRAFVFDVQFSLPSHTGSLSWTPCREEAAVDPQAEGIVVDQDTGVLYVAVETVGIYKIQLHRSLPLVVLVGRDRLIEPVLSFGRSYWAIPDNEEFSCQYDPAGEAPSNAAVAAGTTQFAGKNLQIDVEGLTLYYARDGAGYLIVSSQGANLFHIFSRRGGNEHLGSFAIDGVQETDGIDVTNIALGRAFPFGLFVVHNGGAPEPPNTDPINGFEYDGSTQWKFVAWEDVAGSLAKKLRVDTTGYHPRGPASRDR
jgi:3-phytase